MPLYEYQCDQCGDIFEVMQKFADEPLVSHEKCGGAVHRLISAPALQFKGSGWYITDYAKGSGTSSSGNGSDKKGDSSAKSSSSESGSSSSDNSPAPAPASDTK